MTTWGGSSSASIRGSSSPLTSSTTTESRGGLSSGSCASCYSYSTPPSSLVGYWSLNENGGSTAADSSGLNHLGTLVASPAWVAGKSGSALAFSGSSYVSIADIPEIRGQSEVTVAAWIKRGAASGKVLIGKQTAGNDLAIEAWNDGRVYFGVSNGSYADGDIALTNCIRELKQRGATVVLISHRPATIGVADKVLVLKDGAVEMFGPRGEVLARLTRGPRLQTVRSA